MLTAYTLELAPSRRARQSGRLIMAAPSSVFTISHVAGMLGETEERLQELASEMEPEDGCLIVWGTGDQSITAFTREGVEYLEQLIKDHKAKK